MPSAQRPVPPRKRGDLENAAIDYSAKACAPNAFEVDHMLPVETHPQLAYASCTG